MVENLLTMSAFNVTNDESVHFIAWFVVKRSGLQELFEK